MKTAALGALLLSIIFLLSACGVGQEASVILAGSTSVQPYAEILAEEYAHLRPEKVLDIQGGGSSAGITAVESGTADIGMSSRNLKKSEQHLWKTEIAKDGLGIIVNPSNPVGNLTQEQLRKIYTAEISDWSELGGPAHKIHIITREDGSGTRSAFEELVMGDSRIAPRAIVQNSNGAVRQLIADDPYSIGFISLGLVNIGEKPVKALWLENIEPIRENVMAGDYPLYRSFLFVTKSEPTGKVKEFIDFVLSDKGQRVLSTEGLIEGDNQ